MDSDTINKALDSTVAVINKMVRKNTTTDSTSKVRLSATQQVDVFMKMTPRDRATMRRSLGKAKYDSYVKEMNDLISRGY